MKIIYCRIHMQKKITEWLSQHQLTPMLELYQTICDHWLLNWKLMGYSMLGKWGFFFVRFSFWCLSLIVVCFTGGENDIESSFSSCECAVARKSKLCFGHPDLSVPGSLFDISREHEMTWKKLRKRLVAPTVTGCWSHFDLFSLTYAHNMFCRNFLWE